jgi:hypothetical protein
MMRLIRLLKGGEMTTPDIVDHILAHVGVKGMKWGVRKDRAVDTFVSRGLGISTTGNRERAASRGSTSTKSKSGAQAVTVSDKGKKVKTSGGKGHPAHPDALSAHRLGQVGKKSGLKALSNKELQDYAHRLQLEQNVKRLNYNEMSRGKKFVATLTGKSTSRLGDASINAGAAAMKSSYVRKRAAAGAAALAIAM